MRRGARGGRAATRGHGFATSENCWQRDAGPQLEQCMRVHGSGHRQHSAQLCLGGHTPGSRRDTPCRRSQAGRHAQHTACSARPAITTQHAEHAATNASNAVQHAQHAAAHTARRAHSSARSSAAKGLSICAGAERRQTWRVLQDRRYGTESQAVLRSCRPPRPRRHRCRRVAAAVAAALITVPTLVLGTSSSSRMYPFARRWSGTAPAVLWCSASFWRGSR